MLHFKFRWSKNSVKCQSQWTGLKSKPYRCELSYINVPGENPLQSSTVGQLVEKMASKMGDKECVVVTNPGLVRKTFYQVEKEVLATQLIALYST